MTAIQVDCRYGVGETFVIPAAGEQWYVERFDGVWRLSARVPFNDSTLLVEAVEGQVSVGTAKGPLELNGTQINVNADLVLGETHYRDADGELQKKDGDTWVPVVRSLDSTAVGRAVLNAASMAAARAAIGAGTYTKPSGGIPASDLTTAIQDRLSAGFPYDASIHATIGTRAVGPGSDSMGFRVSRSVTFTEIFYRCGTADASGNLQVEIHQNGTSVPGTASSIAAVNQVAGVAVSGSWTFAEGDILTVYTLAVGTSPGVGLVADLKGTA